jgi:autotransporter family porin
VLVDTHTDFDSDDVREGNGTRVRSVESGGLVTRLGVRAYSRALSDAAHRVQPFLSVHWWHASNENAFMFNDSRQELRRSRDIYELKLGAQAELGASWTGWGANLFAEWPRRAW